MVVLAVEGLDRGGAGQWRARTVAPGVLARVCCPGCVAPGPGEAHVEGIRHPAPRGPDLLSPAGRVVTRLQVRLRGLSCG